MVNKTLEELEHEKKQLEEEEELYKKRAEIKELKKSMRKFQKPTTTKLVMAFIFINCTVVEVYSMWVMWYLLDLSSLYALITAVISESISFAIYAAKAYNETKQEELISLERDRMDLEFSEDDPEGEE